VEKALQELKTGRQEERGIQEGCERMGQEKGKNCSFKRRVTNCYVPRDLHLKVRLKTNPSFVKGGGELFVIPEEGDSKKRKKETVWD